jgi:hypothetical protein
MSKRKKGAAKIKVRLMLLMDLLMLVRVAGILVATGKPISENS